MIGAEDTGDHMKPKKGGALKTWQQKHSSSVWTERSGGPFSFTSHSEIWLCQREQENPPKTPFLPLPTWAGTAALTTPPLRFQGRLRVGPEDPLMLLQHPNLRTSTSLFFPRQTTYN